MCSAGDWGGMEVSPGTDGSAWSSPGVGNTEEA